MSVDVDDISCALWKLKMRRAKSSDSLISYTIKEIWLPSLLKLASLQIKDPNSLFPKYSLDLAIALKVQKEKDVVFAPNLQFLDSQTI
ncbi:hypothetical protein AVEN_37976-1 [Araneus ventricosus]|uniref:Uncharacterized protein n=1 Tax=Araneus ventricosus TaxID=182803 RepID=A0A4Y2R2P1_ARAVE|nr:hypothetical protein AVEN_37976-1 [Araneus ventricosus]